MPWQDKTVSFLQICLQNSVTSLQSSLNEIGQVKDRFFGNWGAKLSIMKHIPVFIKYYNTLGAILLLVMSLMDCADAKKMRVMRKVHNNNAKVFICKRCAIRLPNAPCRTLQARVYLFVQMLLSRYSFSRSSSARVGAQESFVQEDPSSPHLNWMKSVSTGWMISSLR